jgi:hypothetical protein
MPPVLGPVADAAANPVAYFPEVKPQDVRVGDTSQCIDMA